MAITPAWRHWLSYIQEQHLETTGSPHNEWLHITLYRGRYQLSADEAIYSFGDYYINYRLVFERMDFERLPSGAKVLLLGLGLGSIPQMLEQRFEKNYTYTAVEIDEVIIELASDYVLTQLRSPVELICANALHYVDQTTGQYDLICMDVFQDAVVPPEFEHPDFLHQLQQLLRPGGLLLYNRLADTIEHQRDSRAFYDDVFSPIFPEGDCLRVAANYMLVNDRTAFRPRQ